MTEDDTDGGPVGPAGAIEALRTAFEQAIRAGQQRRVRFGVEPVELAMQVGVTRTGTAAAGMRWHVLTLGGERSREAATTQTPKLRLAPVLFDEQGDVLAGPSSSFLTGTTGPLAQAMRRRGAPPAPPAPRRPP